MGRFAVAVNDRHRKQRARQSAKFDADCLAFASALVAFQTERLQDAIRLYRDPDNNQPVFDQKEMGQMAMSVRNAQAVGKLALGEAQSSEKKQLELDLGEQTRNLSYDELLGRLKTLATTEPMRAILADALGTALPETL